MSGLGQSALSVCLSFRLLGATIPDIRAVRAQPHLDRQLLKLLVTTPVLVMEEPCGESATPETEREEAQASPAHHTWKGLGVGTPLGGGSRAGVIDDQQD